MIMIMLRERSHRAPWNIRREGKLQDEGRFNEQVDVACCSLPRRDCSQLHIWGHTFVAVRAFGDLPSLSLAAFRLFCFRCFTISHNVSTCGFLLLYSLPFLNPQPKFFISSKMCSHHQFKHSCFIADLWKSKRCSPVFQLYLSCCSFVVSLCLSRLPCRNFLSVH